MREKLKIGEHVDGYLVDPKTGKIGGKIRPEDDTRLDELLSIARNKIEKENQKK